MSTPPTRSSGRGLRWARELDLTAGAVAGLMCIIAAVGALAFGITPVVFRSGSMSPTISTGALALARSVPAAEIGTGDIISVVDADGTRLTHRVVAIDSVTGNTATLRLQGDANAQPDPQPYAVAEADRVLLHVNRLGYVVAWLSSPAALVAAGLLAAVLILTLRPTRRRARPGDDGAPGPQPRAKPRRRVGTGAALAGGALTAVLVTGQVPGTLASFASSATANAGPFAASRTFVPRISTDVGCDTKLLPLPTTLTLEWKHAGPAYDYKIILRDLSGVAHDEWIVNPPSLATRAAGAAVSQTLSGAGLEGHLTIWRYNAEIHTVLRSSGELSAAWAGYGVYQSTSNSLSVRCSPRGQQDDTSPPYELPARPISLTCATQGTQSLPRTAKLTFEGNSKRYRVIVTERDTGTVVLQLADTANKTATLTAGLLDLSQLPNASEFAANVYSVDDNDVQSLQALSRPLTTAIPGQSGLGCNPDGGSTEPSTQSGARAPLADDADADADAVPPPTTEPSTTEPSTTESSSTPATSAAETPTPTTSAPTTTSALTTTAPTTTTPAPPVEEAELGKPVSSADGAHEAVIVQTESGRAAVVRDMSGAELARVTARAGDSLRWVGDQLWIVSADGASYLDGNAGWSRVIPEPDAIPEEVGATR